MVEEKKGEKREDDLRYKYIGFDVYSSRAKKFWRDPEEEKRYLEEVKKRKEKGEREERDHSLIAVPVFSPVEKWILTVTSVLMILCLFLPWFTFTRGESVMRYNVLQYLFNFGTLMTYSGLGGALLGVLTIIFPVAMLTSLLFGILNLLALYSKTNSEGGYLRKVKKTLRLNFIPFFLWIVAVIISIIGIATPLASAFGVNQLKDNFDVITLVSISGIGLWISLGCWTLNSVKANDL
ncbi:MAG: hypothetical protein MUP17_12215 [candidate division Zixibacteria bacterium]|nr:hypothetical protein [candidate division Zixibacteria bacterium]